MNLVKKNLKKENLNLKNVLEIVIKYLKVSIANKKIDIVFESEENIYINADLESLEIIFRNIISNAIKFSFVGSKIEIKVLKKDETAIVTVKDYGKGIQEDKMKKLFSFDVNKSTLGTNNEKGTGLGLNIVKEYIELNNGKIEISSIENKGTTVKIYF